MTSKDQASKWHNYDFRMPKVVLAHSLWMSMIKWKRHLTAELTCLVPALSHSHFKISISIIIVKFQNGWPWIINRIWNLVASEANQDICHLKTMEAHNFCLWSNCHGSWLARTDLDIPSLWLSNLSPKCPCSKWQGQERWSSLGESTTRAWEPQSLPVHQRTTVMNCLFKTNFGMALLTGDRWKQHHSHQCRQGKSNYV